MKLSLNIGLRIAQALLCILELGLFAYVVSQFTSYYYGVAPGSSSFMIFVSVWTLLVLAYLIFMPKYYPKFYHIYAALGLEIVTNIFWFCGWVAAAAQSGNYSCNVFFNDSYKNACGSQKAGAAFGAIQWILFMITSFFMVRDFLRSRKSGDVAPVAPVQDYSMEQKPMADNGAPMSMPEPQPAQV